MGVITVPAGVSEAAKGIGTTINYFVNSRNFTALDKMFSENKTDDLNTIEKYFNANKNNIYIIADNDYTLIDSDATYNKNTSYYMEDGTIQMDCPACTRINPRGTIKGEDNVEYTCPKCGGKGVLYHTTVPVKIIGITVSVTDNTAAGYSIRYRVVPYRDTKTILIDSKKIYNE